MRELVNKKNRDRPSTHILYLVWCNFAKHWVKGLEIAKYLLATQCPSRAGRAESADRPCTPYKKTTDLHNSENSLGQARVFRRRGLTASYGPNCLWDCNYFAVPSPIWSFCHMWLSCGCSHVFFGLPQARYCHWLLPTKSVTKACGYRPDREIHAIIVDVYGGLCRRGTGTV
jgi:hypothetical protein